MFVKLKLNYFAKSCSFFPIFAATSFATSVVIFDPRPFASLLMLDTISLTFCFIASPVWLVNWPASCNVWFVLSSDCANAETLVNVEIVLLKQ